jgi:ethanolamine ammonia-lyase small subunit
MTLVRDGWAALRRYTPARVGLGRTGVSLPTARHLDLQEALATARDAVQTPLDGRALGAELQVLGLETVELHSAAPDRATYLRRPDLGRRLDAASRAAILEPGGGAPVDLALVVVDGLSAAAVQSHAAALIGAVRELIPGGWTLPPQIPLVHQGRVAVGDEVGELLGARMAAVLIGERPGLSAADSLGIYVTWAPHVGCRDADRNCISNVRAEGLTVAEAARTLAALLGAARLHGRTGVALGQALAAGSPIASLPGKP